MIGSWYIVIFLLVRILTSWFGLYHTGFMWEGYGTCAYAIMLCFLDEISSALRGLLVSFLDFGLTAEFRDFR